MADKKNGKDDDAINRGSRWQYIPIVMRIEVSRESTNQN